MSLEEAFQQQVDKISKDWNLPREEVEQRFRASEPFPACLSEALALELDPASLAESLLDETFWKLKWMRDLGSEFPDWVFPQKSWKKKYLSALKPHEIWLSDWTDLEVGLLSHQYGIPRTLPRKDQIRALSSTISLSTLYTHIHEFCFNFEPLRGPFSSCSEGD